MKQDRAEGWLPATWHGRRGLWRLFLLILIVAGIGRVACTKPGDGEDHAATTRSTTDRSATDRAAEHNRSTPRTNLYS